MINLLLCFFPSDIHIPLRHEEVLVFNLNPLPKLNSSQGVTEITVVDNIPVASRQQWLSNQWHRFVRFSTLLRLGVSEPEPGAPPSFKSSPSRFSCLLAFFFRFTSLQTRALTIIGRST